MRASRVKPNRRPGPDRTSRRRPGRHGRPGRALLAALGADLAALAVAAVVVLGCASGTPGGPSPTATPAPLPSLSASIQLTAGQVEAALHGIGVGLIRPAVEYRPPEPAELMGAPRGVYQAILADEPNAGFIVVYDFPDPASAFDAGMGLARYLASGPGRVQSALDTRHVLRQVGTTLVLFSWSPDDAPAARTPDVALALETIGQGIPIPG